MQMQTTHRVLGPVNTNEIVAVAPENAPIKASASLLTLLTMTARDGGNAKRLSGTIFAIRVGKASASLLTPLAYIPVGKASASLLTTFSYILAGDPQGRAHFSV